jgi:Immunity protein 22
MDGQPFECRKPGFVSLWIGTFPSVEAAEAYFGIPDEIGVYLPPGGFAADLGLDEFPAECLEVNFERTSARPLGDLLSDATFSAEFRDLAIEAASRQGVSAAQGIALVYDFDYQAKPDWQRSAGPLMFIGTFPCCGTLKAQGSTPRRDPRIEIRNIADDVL